MPVESSVGQLPEPDRRSFGHRTISPAARRAKPIPSAQLVAINRRSALPGRACVRRRVQRLRPSPPLDSIDFTPFAARVVFMRRWARAFVAGHEIPHGAISMIDNHRGRIAVAQAEVCRFWFWFRCRRRRFGRAEVEVEICRFWFWFQGRRRRSGFEPPSPVDAASADHRLTRTKDARRVALPDAPSAMSRSPSRPVAAALP